LVVLLAAGSALFFGALAVTIRFALARGIDAEAASLVTTVIAGVICASLAFVPSGLVYGISYACLYSAIDRGRVTIVAP
jgi:uncharacterized membrane protein